MKRSVFSLCAAALLLVSCSKSKNGGKDDVLIPNTPRTEVPDEAVGKWLNGTFSMSNWWSYDGTKYEGNPYTRSSAFNFSKNGDAEFFQVIKTFNGTCATEGFTYFKGTVTFDNEEGSFTIHPQKGQYRGYYSCSPASNFNRAATRDELDPIKLYWGKDTDANGQEWLLTAFTPDPGQGEINFFKPSTW